MFASFSHTIRYTHAVENESTLNASGYTCRLTSTQQDNRLADRLLSTPLERPNE